ncbi:unnamed protein product [Musa acuminata var. zebrina]
MLFHKSFCLMQKEDIHNDFYQKPSLETKPGWVIYLRITRLTSQSPGTRKIRPKECSLLIVRAHNVPGLPIKQIYMPARQGTIMGFLWIMGLNP